MTPSHPFDLTIATNRAVFEYIKKLCAHPDLVEPLIAAVKPLGDVQISYPNSEDCSSVAVSTNGIIFGFAIGMRSIMFRLDNQMKERALATGGTAYSECGPEWVAFEPFRCDWPRVDFEFWARKACVFVRETAQ
jgi:tetrahydromethanopterin S-methyltransferase subunit B